MGQNDFMKALQGAENSEAKAMWEKVHASDKGKEAQAQDSAGPDAAAAVDASKAGGSDGEGIQTDGATREKKRDGVGMDQLLDLDLIQKDEARVYPIIYYTLKELLKEWEQFLAQRPGKWACGDVPLKARS